MSVRLMFAVVFLLAAALPALATFGPIQLANVPIDRVIANLTKIAEAKPKDAEAQFKLARAYAMGYATKKEKVQVVGKGLGKLPFEFEPPKGIKKVPPSDETELWFGFEPLNQPLEVQRTDDKKAEELARTRLAKAVETYEAALFLDPDNLVGRLGYAWMLDQAKRKKEALAEYRKVIEAAWKKEAVEKDASFKRFFTVEAAGYAIPLMDAEKDAAEIAELRRRVAKLNDLPRAITPIAIPLRPGLQVRDIEDRSATITFDVDGSGLKNQRWTWIKPTAGWLVMDRRGTGKIDSGLQLFGNVTFWMFWSNGYEPLAALDDNADGELRGRELAGLAIWLDANSNGRSDPGEVRPLSAHGIIALNCRYQIDRAHPDQIEFSAAGATFDDGTTRPTWDVRLHRK